VAGFGDPGRYRRTSAKDCDIGAFFVPECHRYGGCAWETRESLPVPVCRFANLRSAITTFGEVGWLHDIQEPTMKNTRTQAAAAARASAFDEVQATLGVAHSLTAVLGNTLPDPHLAATMRHVADLLVAARTSLLAVELPSRNGSAA
jgi:hypothetical protein